MPRALLSLTDKTGVVSFAQGLVGLGFELISTGGTAKMLREAGLPVRDVSDVTGFPEMLDGRVKTLHPLIHGGLLGDLRLESHRVAMADAGIEPISVLCVNLYAFEKTATGPHDFEEAVESIDIGGPAMVRAASKNHANVLVVVDPGDYPKVLAALGSGVSPDLRLEFAAKAFRHTAYYDSMIARYLTEKAGGGPFPETLTVGLKNDGLPMRYGENPHQRAARYLDPLAKTPALRPAGSHGKEISYNNWLDAEAAWELVSDLPPGACAIIKHGNPCGAAVGSSLAESYRLAKESDPVSAFGGIVAFHGTVDAGAVAAMTEKGNFLEVLISTGWDSDSLMEAFRSKSEWASNCRFLEGTIAPTDRPLTFRSFGSGMLVQDMDEDPGESGWRVVTERKPDEAQWRALRFQWAIVPHVKSNAIVVGTENRLLGVGAGQMNRVQSVRLALGQAGDGARGAALASDAFFPFPDSIETAAAAGIAAIIQPGGSKKDDAVIAKANELGLAMVFTGTRHFRH